MWKTQTDSQYNIHAKVENNPNIAIVGSVCLCRNGNGIDSAKTSTLDKTDPTLVNLRLVLPIVDKHIVQAIFYAFFESTPLAFAL